MYVLRFEEDEFSVTIVEYSPRNTTLLGRDQPPVLCSPFVNFNEIYYEGFNF
jgi:hypothetical protein